MDCCRLCGISKGRSNFLDYTEVETQDKFKKCGIRLEEIDTLSRKCCSNCMKVVDDFCNFLDNIEKVQEKLKQDIKKIPPVKKIKNEKEIADKVIEKLPRVTRQTKPSTAKKSPNKPSQAKRVKEEIEPDLVFQVKIENEGIQEIKFAGEEKPAEPQKRRKAAKKKEVSHVAPQEKNVYTMEDIFQKELNEGLFDKPIEILNIAENEKNQDGTVNELGLLKFGNFRWSDYTWICVECGFKTNVVTELESHYKIVHKATPTYKCGECPKSCKKYSSCLNHIFEHKPFLKFCCDVCSIYFTNVLDLYNHRITEHKDKRNFLCLYCSKHFDCGSILRYHRAAHLPDNAAKLFNCDLCEKSFSVKHNLTSHLQRHANALSNRNHVCELCGMAFRQKGNLVSHQLTHSDLRPFKCEVCEETFKTFKRLRYHSLTHSKVKNHECDVCHRMFALKTTLKVHYRIHSGVTPYECEFCGKKFRFNHCLKTHRRLHTGERPYHCAECNHSFTNWPNFNKHSKIRHNTDLSKRNKKKELEQNYLLTNNQMPNLYDNNVVSVIPSVGVVTFEVVENQI